MKVHLYCTIVREAKAKVWTCGRAHPYCTVVREAQANALDISYCPQFFKSRYIPVPTIAVNAL